MIIEDDDEYYYVHDYFDLQTTRDYFFKTTFYQGKYHIIPISTGALLKRPYELETIVPNLDINESYQYSTLHPDIESVLGDIFRKIDIQCNSQLDAREINAFGKIVENDYFKSLLSSDFNKENFNRSCCTKKGLTEYGFKYLVLEQVTSHLILILNLV